MYCNKITIVPLLLYKFACMRPAYLAFIAVVCLCYGCEKKKNAAPATVTTTTHPIDTTKVASIYPYTDTFYGAYSENNNGSDYPPNYSGYSTVLITHTSVDSFSLYSLSIGIPVSDTLSFSFITNDSAFYTFGRNRFGGNDHYNCNLYKDSIICWMEQEGDDPVHSDYTGTYKGFIK